MRIVLAHRQCVGNTPRASPSREVLANYDRDPSKAREINAGEAAFNLAFALRAQSCFDEAVAALQRVAIKEKSTS